MEMKCEGCGKIHSLKRTPEIPKHVLSMSCNWCPECEDKADDYYNEWYNETDYGKIPKPYPVPNNQLCMPFCLSDDLQNALKQNELCSTT